MIATRHWWKYLLSLLVFGAVAVLFLGIETYRGAPPIADFAGPDGAVVVPAESIHRGQAVFQRYALMEYGSMFGDGGGRGPDFTGEALHQVAVFMTAHYALGASDTEDDRAARAARVRRELRANTFDPARGRVTLTAGHARAYGELVDFYTRRFTGPGPDSFRPAGYLTDRDELRDLSSFFFWGAWVCSAARPGTQVSYTHNWPYDELAGNTLTSASVFWSVVGSFALLFVLGVTMYAFGRASGRPGFQPSPELEPAATASAVDAFVPTPTQRATYKFFAVAGLLFLLQVLSGVLTVHDFVGFTTFFGYDISRAIPLTVSRSWHLQLALLWIATCWIAGSVFVLPRIAKGEPAGQRALVSVLFTLLAVTVLGMLAGTLLGPRGSLGAHWRLLGNQGWEFVELGSLWQLTLFAALLLWALVVYRGVRPALRALQPFALPNWILYAVVAIAGLFVSSFVAQPRTNFVIADFWRWMVVHMWAECFFEVFTTVIVAWYLVQMGLLTRERATRIVFFSTLLFCGSGFVGIAHNFYWNAKPEATLALGSVFSTMQVVPLMLVTLEAWRFSQSPAAAMRSLGKDGVHPAFGLSESYLFLVGVNFWNFFGAGVLGFLINLPMVNYFEHGTYLTVNHGHAALMGVYGNLSVAAMLFCCRYLMRPERWSPGLLRVAFWSMNVGLLLMVLLDLFPVGILQLRAVLERGLWYARSQEFVQSSSFQTLTWMRLVGGALFVLGGVFPLTWFMLAGFTGLRDARPQPLPAAVDALGAVSLRPGDRPALDAADQGREQLADEPGDRDGEPEPV